MGQEASKPDPNVQLKVIGCGNSRTGTTSFARAVEILLGGPVYHGGTHLWSGSEDHMKKWIEISKHTPIRSPEDRGAILCRLKDVVSGYTCVVDYPVSIFVEELIELFPDATLICTTRDRDEWWRSMEPVVNNTKSENQVLGWIFMWLPTLRYWQDFVDAIRPRRWTEVYYSKPGVTQMHRGSYDDHMEYLERVVPKSKLHFYDVKDGWAPLCKILDVPVPEGEEFPRMNDAAYAETFFKKQIAKGLMAWAAVGATTAAAMAVGWQVWKTRR